jgi:hypothetical protein
MTSTADDEPPRNLQKEWTNTICSFFLPLRWFWADIGSEPRVRT